MDPKEIGALTPGIVPGPAARPAGKPVQIPPTSAPSFRAVLEQQAGQPLKFSAHALARLQSRNINLSNDDVARMNHMADKAAQKGAKQSLFMLRDVAMVVSITNRTVITAVDPDSMRENVFTNIDSAAII
ncbi:MAG TPA: TIGR02530 family flagellar biosynthesis protein [Candidatus Baltobacteraceae bacterium]|jgi:flagellar operon protein